MMNLWSPEGRRNPRTGVQIPAPPPSFYFSNATLTATSAITSIGSMRGTFRSSCLRTTLTSVHPAIMHSAPLSSRIFAVLSSSSLPSFKFPALTPSYIPLITSFCSSSVGVMISTPYLENSFS
ncbi:122aa long hypothetical protein [Pyrococcus horikoshii OT3]|uniref:Uncharacterized protein n=1 Tax=Pyrococcus horikoshii (strain ATCC 700860 / DSM 12428 / JCM 9974 / NBRC 100139 / OT-3) TaxID=70601 RepID=O58402_PYRHO|nr:122aa long hypothetical protein [Pyrococcus horikoshii OT3]